MFDIITNGTTAITFSPTIGVNCTDAQRSRAALTAYCTAYTSSIRINCTFLSALVVTSAALIGTQMPRRESQNIASYRSIAAHQHCLLVIVVNRHTIHCAISIFCKKGEKTQNIAYLSTITRTTFHTKTSFCIL